MKTINQTVGNNLKKLRDLSGFTQSEVAKAVGIERSAFSNYEEGTREVPYNILEKLSNLFGCEASLLFENDEESKNELFATSFRLSSLNEIDLNEIANFKDIVKSYLKMERIANDKTE